jgi:hypothetical protein
MTHIMILLDQKIKHLERSRGMLRKGQHIQSEKQTIFEKFYGLAAQLAQNNPAFRFEKICDRT